MLTLKQTNTEPFKKDFDKAFDELAKFLLDEYRKHQREMEVTVPSSVD